MTRSSEVPLKHGFLVNIIEVKKIQKLEDALRETGDTGDTGDTWLTGSGSPKFPKSGWDPV